MSFDTIEAWVSQLGATACRRPPEGDPYLVTGNTEAFLRALYLQLALGPEPPGVRADLLLLLVDVLRASNPGTLRPTDQ